MSQPVDASDSHEKFSVEKIAATIDHAILHPTANDEEIKKELAVICAYPLASVCIKPYAVRLAAEMLRESPVKAVCTVIGFPHGSSQPEVKAFEAERAFVDGAREVDMVVNIGKVLSDDWSYVRQDIAAVREVTRRNGGILKVIFETDFLPRDEHKIELCRICSELKVDFVKTSTGFGFVKSSDGKFFYKGAAAHDVKLMRKECAPEVGVKASGGIRTLEDALQFLALGATRLGTSSTVAICAAAAERFGGSGFAQPVSLQAGTTNNGY